MSIHLQSVYLKHERRIRAIFDNTLASGAFSTLTFYTITSLDGKGTNPSVVAAFAVSGNGSSVELSLGTDLVGGGLYSFSAIGVPAIDSSVTDGSNILQFTFPNDINNVQNQEISPLIDMGLVLYGRDLVWNGTDMQEDASGDLATVSGNPNVQSAIKRRHLSEGLVWDQTYGVKPRQFVDGSALAATTLQGSIIQQTLADPRTKSATTQIIDDDDPTSVTFLTNVILIGSDILEPIDISVQTSG